MESATERTVSIFEKFYAAQPPDAKKADRCKKCGKVFRQLSMEGEKYLACGCSKIKL